MLLILGLGTTIFRAAGLQTLGDPSLPQWITIVSMVGMPAVSLIGIVFTLLHVENRIHHTEAAVDAHVDRLESTINGKMTKLLELNRQAYLLEGEMVGRRLQAEEMLAGAAADRNQKTHDRAMRQEGAEDLLVKQATPPAVHLEPTNP